MLPKLCVSHDLQEAMESRPGLAKYVALALADRQQREHSGDSVDDAGMAIAEAQGVDLFGGCYI